MDFIIELIGEIIMEALASIIESDRVPKFVRYILLVLFLVPLLVLLGFGIYSATDAFLIVFLGVIAIGLIAAFVYFVYNINRSGILRRAKKEELPQVLKMYRSVIGKPGCSWTVFYPNEVTLQDDFNTGNLYVLYKGSKLIGAASIVPKNELDDLGFWNFKENAREIARIVIAPNYQSKGYGKHLVKKLCHRLESMGCKAVHILVAVENHHGLNLFRNTGFRNIATCTRYDHDHYAYEKKL